jgi:transposase
MYYVGIDIAKHTHVAAIMNEDNSLKLKPFSFSNDKEGFKKLLIHLQTLCCDLSDIVIGMEATGLLFENLYRHLQSLEYNVVLLNPYQTAKFREMDTMKRVKNDNIDSVMIAALLKSGRFSEGYVSQEQLQSLRELDRHRNTIENQLKAIKRQTSAILTVVFPELESVIRDPFSVTGLALLEKYPTATHYHHASVERILKTFRGIKGNNFSRTKAQALLHASKNSVYSGVASEARALNIRMNIAQIRLLQTQLDEILLAMQSLFTGTQVKQEHQEVMEDMIDNLRTLPGVADKTILALLAECGNLDRFYAPKALIGFFGLYPTLSQSGDSTRNGRLAKRGASLAKKAIYLASIAAIRHNDEMRTIYMKYRSKGRAKKEAIIIVARKLLTIMYIIYIRNIPYDPQRVFVAKPNQ